ncbi:MAG: hypothetical protein OEY11_15155 [Gammaproteobacteria bacterium]|nr:hypothetical protein [Gammaproteobacteria bacterium]
MAGKITDLSLLTEVDGDNDLIEVVDDDEAVVADKNKKVPAKHLTGGMVAHGDSLWTALYHKTYSNLAVKTYIKLANIPSDGNVDYQINLTVSSYSPASAIGRMVLHIGNYGGLYKRVTLIDGKPTNFSVSGIQVYLLGDSSIDVFMVINAALLGAISAYVICQDRVGVVSAIPPHKVVETISTPLGTLSFDTTAGKYINGVPDGNEDWIAGTLLNASGTVYYRRHENGLVEIQFKITGFTLTADGTVLFNVPAGYRTTTLSGYVGGIIAGNASAGVGGRIK